MLLIFQMLGDLYEWPEIEQNEWLTLIDRGKKDGVLTDQEYDQGLRWVAVWAYAFTSFLDAERKQWLASQVESK